MRVTTYLLRGHVPPVLAEIIESYLMSNGFWIPKYGFSRPKKDWFSIAIGEHMELIAEVLSDVNNGDIGNLLGGFCLTGNIPMIHECIAVINTHINAEEVVRSKPRDVTLSRLANYDMCLVNAISNGHVEAAKIMLNNGARLRMHSEITRMIKSALCDGDPEMAQLIYDMNVADRSVFIECAGKSGDMEMLKLLGIVTQEERKVLFSYLCAYGHYDEVRAELASFMSDESNHETASFGIHFAVMFQENPVTKLLLKHGAKPNAGMTEACRRAHYETIKLLIESGATECGCGKPIGDHTKERTKKRRLDIEKEARDGLNEFFKNLKTGLPSLPSSDDDDEIDL